MKVKEFKKNAYCELIKYAFAHCNKILFYKNNDFSNLLDTKIKAILLNEKKIEIVIGLSR